ncbi:DUF6262 family protein [Nonomuraea sp. SYSU D8015]|uniref:DUF6262 family protein n=1 Tax=Nonomuraea sp. SYSU D8015 TaxID=2593644 RepID=UPI001CB71BFA|nr:DUF6262 family protein [Nonomuraea sp. SYSU D8015]
MRPEVRHHRQQRRAGRFRVRARPPAPDRFLSRSTPHATDGAGHERGLDGSRRGERRQRRVDALAAAARRKSESKLAAAESAIKRLIKQDAPVTFQAVQREAGVSHSFLYGHPMLRRRIEQLRQRRMPPRAERARADGCEGAASDNVVLALTAEIARLKRVHRLEMAALREALERAHGENLILRRQLGCLHGEATGLD